MWEVSCYPSGTVLGPLIPWAWDQALCWDWFVWTALSQIPGEILPPTAPCLKRGNRASAGRPIVGGPLHWPALDYRQPLKGQPWNLIWSFTGTFWIRNLNNNFPFAQPFNCEIQSGSFEAAGNVTALRRDFARILLKCLQVSFPYLTNFSF